MNGIQVCTMVFYDVMGRGMCWGVTYWSMLADRTIDHSGASVKVTYCRVSVGCLLIALLATAQLSPHPLVEGHVGQEDEDSLQQAGDGKQIVESQDIVVDSQQAKHKCHGK